MHACSSSVMQRRHAAAAADAARQIGHARILHELQQKLSTWTGRRWIVVISKEQGERTLREQANDRQAALRQEVLQDPLVQAVLKKFPGAKVGEITQTADEPHADEGLAAPTDTEEDD